MDVRQTLNEQETFLQLLQDLFQAQDKASLLVDDNGITRAEGFIKVIRADAVPPFIELDNAVKIPIKTIIALNGIFLSDYSEC